MKKIIFILPLLAGSCNSSEKTEQTETAENIKTDSIAEAKPEIYEENKCVSLVEVLPEVNSLADEIEMNSKGKNHLTIWIAADPSETKIKYYWVKVGEDNGDNVATLMNFYVDPKHEEVLFYDMVNDSLITLDVWRDNATKE